MFYQEHGYDAFLFTSDWWTGLINICKTAGVGVVCVKPENNGFNILTTSKYLVPLFSRRAVF